MDEVCALPVGKLSSWTDSDARLNRKGKIVDRLVCLQAWKPNNSSIKRSWE